MTLDDLIAMDFRDAPPITAMEAQVRQMQQALHFRRLCVGLREATRRYWQDATTQRIAPVMGATDLYEKAFLAGAREREQRPVIVNIVQREPTP